MVKGNDILILGAVVGAGYLVYKWKNPLTNLAGAANDVVETGGKLLDYGSGAVQDVLGGNSQNEYKTIVQETARDAARQTTTLYDDLRNQVELYRDSLKNLFRSEEDKIKSTLDRYAMSYDNSKFIDDERVRSVLLYDKNENLVGSYNNELMASLNVQGTLEQENKLNNIKNSSSSGSNEPKKEVKSSSTKKKVCRNVTRINSKTGEKYTYRKCTLE